MRNDLKIGIILGVIVVVLAILIFAVGTGDSESKTSDTDISAPSKTPAPKKPAVIPEPQKQSQPIIPPPVQLTGTKPEPVVPEPCVVSLPPVFTAQPKPVTAPLPKPEPVIEPPLPKVIYHTVAKGENLSQISEQHYGDQRHWKVIYQANRDIIGANPDKLRPGTKLRIPSPEEIAGP